MSESNQMPNTPKPPDRPDVEGIAARVKHGLEVGWPHHGIYNLCTQDIPALIAHIEALEAAGIAVLMETSFAIKPASGEPIVGIRNEHGPAHRELRDLLAGLPVTEVLAALDGGGDG